MDAIGIKQLMEELIKKYESTETYDILFYSKDFERDFKILADNVKRYRERLDVLLALNDDQSRQAIEVRKNIST